MEYENIVRLARCYGCDKQLIGEEALFPVLIVADIIDGQKKALITYVAHRNSGCITKAREQVDVRLGNDGFGILRNVVVKR